jgi:SAM-dependent methyltransferase
LMGHATDGSLYDLPRPERAAQRSVDTDSWSAGTGVEDFVRSQLPPPPARVLEVGCGSGELAFALSAGGWRVIAVDPEAPDGEPFVRAAVEELGMRPITGPSTPRSRCSPCTTPGRQGSCWTRYAPC